MQFEKHANYMPNPAISKKQFPLVLHVGFEKKISASFPIPNVEAGIKAIKSLPDEAYFLLERN